MSAATAYEIIGYTGSALIVISLTRTSLLKLRLFGLAGSVTFVVYSLLIEAYPIAVVNVVIAGIHLWFIRRLLSRTDEFFTILPVSADSEYLGYFLDFHRAEIDRHHPEFVHEPAPSQTTAFILRDAVPAGLFIGAPHQDGTFEVKLDFVVPAYRDFKAGDFLYSTRSGVFAGSNCDTAWAEPGSEEHIGYLERQGFEATTRGGRPVHSRDISGLREPPPAGAGSAVTVEP